MFTFMIIGFYDFFKRFINSVKTFPMHGDGSRASVPLLEIKHITIFLSICYNCYVFMAFLFQEDLL